MRDIWRVAVVKKMFSPLSHSNVPAVETWCLLHRRAPCSHSRSPPPPQSQRSGRWAPRRSPSPLRSPTDSRRPQGSCCPRTGHGRTGPWFWPPPLGDLHTLWTEKLSKKKFKSSLPTWTGSLLMGQGAVQDGRRDDEQTTLYSQLPPKGLGATKGGNHCLTLNKQKYWQHGKKKGMKFTDGDERNITKWLENGMSLDTPARKTQFCPLHIHTRAHTKEPYTTDYPC